MEIGAGSTLGRYQLLTEIGRGAMGIVYQAMDPEIDRIVAIKTFSLLDAGSSEGQAFRERFAQEARAAGRLTHPGIVAIYDRGEEPTTQTPYIVMEYVAGQPLSALLVAAAGRLEEGFALKVAKEVAEALAYAHEKGVIHRDVKPANILITEDGNAKVADFGVARLDLSNLTINGEVFGTPAYMAPEQITGGTVDRRSDIFSLGVILYTMLIGFRPFQGNSLNTVGFKVVNQEPVPITSFHLDLSKHSEYVVARAMAKNPAARYQTGTEFAQDLGDILEGREPRSRQDVTVRVSPEVFHVSQGYRPFAAMMAKLDSHPKHISTFSDPAVDKTPVNTALATPTPIPTPTVPMTAVAPGLVAVPAPAPVAAPAQASVVVPAPAPQPFIVPEATPVEPVADAPKPPAAVVPRPAFVFPRGTSATAALLAIACVGAFAGVSIDHAQRTALRTADARLGMPPLLSEALPAPPALRIVDSEPEVEVRVIKPKPAPARASQPKPATAANLDYTIVRKNKPQPVAPVMVAATSESAPAPKPTIPVAPPATVELALQHHFADADFSVWVDNKLVFSDSVHGEEKKRLLLLHGVEGKETHEIHLPSGQHDVKVRVVSAAADFDHTESIHGSFKESGKTVLSVHCTKRGIELKMNSGS